MGLPVRCKGAIAIAIPSTYLLITLSAWVWSRLVVTVIRARVDYSEAVIGQSQTLQALLVDAEAGMRGYILTRDPTFLQPYNHTQTVIENEFAQLRDLVQQDTNRLSTLQRLEALSQQRLFLLEAVLIEAQALSTTELLPLLQQGKQVMEQFRNTVSLLEQSETELLSRYNQQRDRIIYLTTLVLWLTVVASLLSLLTAISLFSTLDQTSTICCFKWVRSFSNAPSPTGQAPKISATRRLILLDLNMPKMSGIEFLHELRADQNCK